MKTIHRYLFTALAAGLGLVPAVAKAIIQATTPTPEVVRQVVREGDANGWEALSNELRDRSLEAYLKGYDDAETWYYLYRWADLLGREQPDLIHDWVEAIEKTGRNHANLANSYSTERRPAGDLMSRELKQFLLNNKALSREFFEILSPYDNTVQVFVVLNRIYQLHPNAFRRYPTLALAIAIVYDMPPPPGWPHGQVPASILPRALPDPAVAFDYWARLDQSRQSAQPLSRLPAEVLKFVVDTPASIEDLMWARVTVKTDTKKFGDAYKLVKYRYDRLNFGQFMWGESSYRLKTIQQHGGICVDQAYFAAQAGKARGLPTLIFRGTGLDGRHAWFGVLKPDGTWDFDAGRWGENQFVTGFAHDPQTWGDITDHELKFLDSGFRQSHYFQQATFHASMAAELLDAGALAPGLEAARQAVNYEPRNRLAWEALLVAEMQSAEDDETAYAAAETVLRRAADAFREFPDLEAWYFNRVSSLLEEQGETARAARTRDGLAVGNRGDREDIAVAQAVKTLEQSMARDPVSTQMREYRVILGKHGKTRAMDVFDRIVKPFITHLVTNGYRKEARLAANLASNNLEAPNDSMLRRELDAVVRAFEN